MRGRHSLDTAIPVSPASGDELARNHLIAIRYRSLRLGRVGFDGKPGAAGYVLILEPHLLVPLNQVGASVQKGNDRQEIGDLPLGFYPLSRFVVISISDCSTYEAA
jgi:hypothetical protein